MKGQSATWTVLADAVLTWAVRLIVIVRMADDECDPTLADLAE
jgi:hypothetical protein